MYHILNRRLMEQTSQIVSVDFINRHINKLAYSINECLKAEENLRLSSVKEEKQFKEMMANISHDLRTPLTAIKGSQQMLLKEQLTKEQQSRLHVAMKHTDMLENRIEQFFEYTYLVNHTPKYNGETFNLTNLVAEYLVDSITMFEDRNMEIVYDDSIQIQVIADKEWVGRILQNLIRNCIQHAKECIYVRIITNEIQGEVSMAGISFSNKIPENHNIDANRLFERFYTPDDARKHSTGLGLAIVKLLAEQMDGLVSASIKDDKLEIRVLFKQG